MNVIIIFNGLGNQMSQYAFYLQKKALNDKSIFLEFCSDHNGFELCNVFALKTNKNIRYQFLYLIWRILLTEKYPFVFVPLKSILNFFNFKIVKENFDYKFNPEHLKPHKGVHFYQGGWHSEEYFKAEEKAIYKTFQFNVPSDSSNMEVVDLIKNTNSISIHVRRGDYLNKDNLNLFGKVCDKNYFLTAIKKIKERVEQPHFFIFSNDMDWVRENLPCDNTTYVDFNSKQESWKDMYLMSICNHNIIANSSFSWWGAWLNKNPDKIVISPKQFLNDDPGSDIYPETWTKLSNY